MHAAFYTLQETAVHVVGNIEYNLYFDRKKMEKYLQARLKTDQCHILAHNWASITEGTSF